MKDEGDNSVTDYFLACEKPQIGSASTEPISYGPT